MHLDDSNGLDIVRFIGAAKERPALPFDRPRLVIQRPLHFTCRLRAFMPVLECHMQATKRRLRAHLADWLNCMEVLLNFTQEQCIYLGLARDGQRAVERARE